MRKIVNAVLILITALLTACAVGCDGKEEFDIVCTVFPAYDICREIVGDALTAEVLQDTGDVHNYEPSLRDIHCIKHCKVFVLIGGESEAWAEKLLASEEMSSVKTVLLMNAVEPLAEEDGEEEDETEYDEHIWTTPKNVQAMTEYLYSSLKEVFPDLDGEKKENYRRRLSALSDEYKAVCDGAPIKTLVVCDRFPFRYLTEEYGLRYYAAFSGCSSSVDVSPAVLVRLKEKVKETNVPCVFILETGDIGFAKAVLDGADKKILCLQSAQSVQRKDMATASLYRFMQSNLEVLREALGYEIL